MKRRLFTGVAAAAALAATLMIGNVGQAAAADPPAEAASATTAQKTGVTPNSRIPGTSPVRVDEAKFKTVETLRGIGKQVYECTNGTYALREPVAGLITLRGIPAGIHGKGPFWALFDGSKVSKPAASTAASDSALSGASNVPWLLVPVAPEGTGGSLSNVQLVQRIDTRGGVAPATCVGRPQTLTVDYSANYVFWAPK